MENLYLEDEKIQEALEYEVNIITREAVRGALQEIAREHGISLSQAIYDEVKKQITKEHVERLVEIVKQPVGGEPA